MSLFLGVRSSGIAQMGTFVSSRPLELSHFGVACLARFSSERKKNVTYPALFTAGESNTTEAMDTDEQHKNTQYKPYQEILFDEKQLQVRNEVEIIKNVIHNHGYCVTYISRPLPTTPSSIASSSKNPFPGCFKTTHPEGTT